MGKAKARKLRGLLHCSLAMAPLILLAGHSFVRRLASDRGRNGDTVLRFNLRDQFFSFLQGHSGASVAFLRAEIVPFIWGFMPTHVILDIGTNELACRGSHPEGWGTPLLCSHVRLRNCLMYVPCLC